MTYDYKADALTQPTPADVRATRLKLELTQQAAAERVHRTDSARWREWERDGATGRVIDLAVWELFLIKSGLRRPK
jgi:DNA-binding transcriptional regulator YiaG